MLKKIIAFQFNYQQSLNTLITQFETWAKLNNFEYPAEKIPSLKGDASTYDQLKTLGDTLETLILEHKLEIAPQDNFKINIILAKIFMAMYYLNLAEYPRAVIDSAYQASYCASKEAQAIQDPQIQAPGNELYANISRAYFIFSKASKKSGPRFELLKFAAVGFHFAALDYAKLGNKVKALACRKQALEGYTELFNKNNDKLSPKDKKNYPKRIQENQVLIEQLEKELSGQLPA